MRTKSDKLLRRTHVGKLLQQWRIAAGLTQAEVAKAFNYSTAQFISNWERGVSLPPISTMPLLVELYAVDPQRLLDALLTYQEKVMAEEAKRLRRLLGVR